MPNEIASIKTVPLYGADVDTFGVMIALNITDPSATEAFVSQVVEQFKVHRTCSPPTTSVLVVSIIGRLDPIRFLSAWRSLLSSDPVLNAYIRLMDSATAVHGTPAGRVLEKFSLLPTALHPPSST